MCIVTFAVCSFLTLIVATQDLKMINAMIVLVTLTGLCTIIIIGIFYPMIVLIFFKLNLIQFLKRFLIQVLL
jgi:hypothetical protein